MIKHVIWDWNGTLVNDLELCVDILNLALIEHGKLPISVDQYKESFCFPVSKFYKLLACLVVVLNAKFWQKNISKSIETNSNNVSYIMK